MFPSRKPATGQYVEVRVTVEERHLHIRADLYRDGVHVGFAAEREKIGADATGFEKTTARQIVNALHRELCQQPLF